MHRELTALLEGRPVWDEAEEPSARADPWLIWLAVCLCRQRAKQTWACDIARQLNGYSGDIPFLPGWRSEHHGGWLYLVGPNGDSVDMDFAGDEGRTIDPYFFAARVMSLKDAATPEAELRRWLPDRHLVVAALDALRERGDIGHPTSGHVFRFSPALEALHARVAAIEFSEELFAWRVALEAGGDPSGPRHAAWLLSLLADRRRASVLLEPIATMLPRTVMAVAVDGLIREPDALAAAAIDWCAQEHVDVTQAVRALIPRLQPETDHPYIGCAVGEYLLQRGVDRVIALDVVRRFAVVEQVKGFFTNPMIDRLGAILLEHSPEEALGAVRRSLRGIPLCAANTAALLACIDEPWCHAELEAVLDDRMLEPAVQRRAALALQASTSAAARERGARLAPPAPVIEGMQDDPGSGGLTFDAVDAVMLDTVGVAVAPGTRELGLRLKGRPPPG